MRLQAKNEALEWEAFQNGTTIPADGEGSLPALPSFLQPSFWSMLSLGVSLSLHGLMVLGKGWSIDFCAALTCSSCELERADTVFIRPRQHRGQPELVPLVWGVRRRGVRQAFFIFQRRKWLLADDGSVSKLRLPVRLPLGDYFKTEGLASSQAVEDAREEFGPNKFEIPAPTFLPLFKQGLMAPLSVFQLFSVSLWMLDEYWQFSLLTLVMLLVFEATVVFSRLKSIGILQGMGNKHLPIMVYRRDSWQEIKTDDLLPGDIVSMTRSDEADVIPADCVILRGGAVVNEATLTGESVPQMKEALPPASATSGVPLEIKGAHKLSVLYSGSTILQHSAGAPIDDDDILLSPDGGCVCFVLRTGFSSSQGKLMRMIEYSSEKVSSDSKEAFYLLAFLLVFALSAAGYVLYQGMQDENRSQYELLLHCILIVSERASEQAPIPLLLYTLRASAPGLQ